MIVCKFKIKGCAIVAESLPVVAEQNVGTVQAAFDFSADWDGYTKYAVFFRHNGETPLRQVIASDSTCTIPSAMLAENKTMYIGVYGENADSRMNSAVAAFKPIEGAYRVAVFPGEEPYDPSIWTQLWNAIDAKQDIIGDLSDIRENAQTGADLVPEVEALQTDLSALELRVEANENSIDDIEDDIDDINDDIATLDSEKYEKPSTGIPKTDLASAVQTSLDKANAAYKKPAGGIPKFDLTTQVQESLDKADSALQSVPSTYATKTYVDSHHDATKQDKLTAGENITIEDNVISATGGGGGGAVDSVNGQTGDVVLDAEDVGALGKISDLDTYAGAPMPDQIFLAIADTPGGDNAKIRGDKLGFYSTPASGIPKTDLASAVQTSLDNADASVSAISAINGKIPAAASSSNKLVSQSEMGDAIEAVEAKQIYATASQGSFATKAALTSASTFYNADGTVATPTKNDVAYVLADESHSGKSAKYVISDVSGGSIVWGFVITFSDTTFTQAQMDAVNSGITAAILAALQAGNIYWCTYGTTTSAQVDAALDAGKLPVCVYSDRYYIYAGLSNAYHCFASLTATTYYRLYLKGSWGNGSVSLSNLYSKPSGGIPEADLASAVQNKLHSVTKDPEDHVYRIDGNEIAAKYDDDLNDIAGTYATKTALSGKYTKPSGGIPKTDLAAAVQTSLGLADTALQSSQKGSVNGVAELDENGRVPSAQLPSYVDDVLEYASTSAFPATGEAGKIYVATNTNLTYRWTGSAYTEISPSLALGENSSTAYRGDRGKTAYDHSQATGNPHGTTLAQISEDSTHRTVTDAEKTAWNAKGTYSKPASGIPASDLAAGVIPTVPTALSQLSDDSTHRTVTDTEKAAWNAKENAGKITISGVEKTVSSHTVTIVTNGTTTTMTLVGVS